MIDQTIRDFVELAIEKELVDQMDAILITNQLLHILQKDDFNESLKANHDHESLLPLLDQMVSYAINQGIIDNSQKELLEAEIMALVTPLPSQLNKKFWTHYQESPEKATDYFYQLSQDNDYIKTRAIANNIEFSHDSEYGPLQITINLSKPEKDPKEIAKAKLAKSSNYPASQLTMTNEGYYGRLNHPARYNHRIVRLHLEEDPWGFQYSPYSYFNEHSIFLSQEVRPMQITEKSIRNLLLIIQQFPHYFVGSNADLPIVGGSILSHDHYQAGRYTFPMELAPAIEAFKTDKESVEMTIVKWPMSVIRLRSQNIEDLSQVAGHILEKWIDYSDPSQDIVAYTDGVRHNTITPIARYKDNAYELDLVLRNNRTSDQYPDGIFHPHQNVQHIKKENIGLIEVMGLAILPPRLKDELQEVEKYLLDQPNQLAPMHKDWADKIKESQSIPPENVHQEVEYAVGEDFKQELEDSGVFKQTKKGQEAFKRFVESL